MPGVFGFGFLYEIRQETVLPLFDEDSSHVFEGGSLAQAMLQQQFPVCAVNGGQFSDIEIVRHEVGGDKKQKGNLCEQIFPF